MAEKQRLKISRWDIAKNKVAGDGDPFEVMLNPSGYTVSRTVQLTRDAKTNGRQCEALTLEELVLDGTGVVRAPGGTPLSVQEQLAKLQAVMTVEPVGGKVVRPVVEVVWGTLYFIGRVENVKTRYTLFAPDGTPLRARVSLTLAEFEGADKSKWQPPRARGMIRQLPVEAEVRLPELCFQVYQSTAMLESVARHNGLTSFRNVPAGTRIICPARG
jgi:hypothetical protein